MTSRIDGRPRGRESAPTSSPRSRVAASFDASNTCDEAGYYFTYPGWDNFEQTRRETRLLRVDDDELVYELTTDPYEARRRIDAEGSIEVTYRRQPAWLVPPALVGVDNWPVDCETAETRVGRHSPCEADTNRSASSDSNSTDDAGASAVPSFHGLSASEVVRWALDLRHKVTTNLRDPDTHAPFSWAGWDHTPDFTLAKGDGYVDPYSTSSSWTMWPNLEAGYDYFFVIVVPVTAGYPHATMRPNDVDTTQDLGVATSDDGTMYVLAGKYTKASAREVEIHYQGDASLRDIPSALVIYRSAEAP